MSKRKSRRNESNKCVKEELLNGDEKLEKEENTTIKSKNVKAKKQEKLMKGGINAKASEVKQKAGRKRAMKEETSEDNQLEVENEPQPKKTKGSKGKSAPEEVAGRQGRDKKETQENGNTPSEDVKHVIESKVKVKSEAPKKKKKGEDEPVPRPVKYESLGEGPPHVPCTGLKYMGSHVSAAGGIWNAFENAKLCKSKSFALFLRNQRQWNAKPLEDETVEKWADAMKDFPPHLVLPHGSYLMNLGSPVPETLEKSRNMLLEELQRCQSLGIPHYNFHPGSTTGKISREECCKTIAESINLAHSQTKGVICVLENMSCQGFTIGGDLHELRLIIEYVKDRSRVGVCLDTCHAHAAGYDLSTEAGFQELLDDFEKIIGWQFLRGLHINDSKGEVGDHKDRHENIGKGTIGIDGFRRVMNCDHFNDLPLILETPWTSNEGYAKEVVKLESIIRK